MKTLLNRIAGCIKFIINEIVDFLSYISGAIPFVFTIMAFVFFVYIPFDQIECWLKNGYFPDRDLYWIFSDNKCLATNWESSGFYGQDICRNSYINFTDWVGVNKIINFIFDIHLTILFTIVCVFTFILFLIIILILNNIRKQ